MKFKRLINKSKETRRKYEYYLSLGYSEHAAKVLSVVTYGDEKLVFLINQLGRKNVMEELYAWLHERKEGTPEEAIEAFYEEKHPRPKYEEERGSGVQAPVSWHPSVLPVVFFPEELRQRKQLLPLRFRKT